MMELEDFLFNVIHLKFANTQMWLQSDELTDTELDELTKMN